MLERDQQDLRAEFGDTSVKVDTCILRSYLVIRLRRTHCLVEVTP